MASVISAGLTTTTSLVYTADTSGILQLQTNGTTTAVTIDTAQNIGVGVTPNSWNSSSKVIQFGSSGTATLENFGGITSVIAFNNYRNTSNQFVYTTSYPATQFGQDYTGKFTWNVAGSGTAGTLINGTGSFTTAMTLDNIGRLLLGGTSVDNSAFMELFYSGTTYNGIVTKDSSSSGTTYSNVFVKNGSVVGSIGQTTTTTTYATSSDRRLKTNIVDLTNSGTVIDSLKPRAFTWISNNSADAGFIADEIQQVLPKAVTGQPNETKEEEYEVTPAVKDEQGNITTPAVMGTRTVPVYQMIDASQPELIAYLVAEVQSLRARLKAANIA